MEQAKAEEQLEAHIVLLERALENLTDALREPYTDFMRDAIIKRFEYVFELSWKTIQIAVNFIGSRCNSPREAIRSAFQQNWTQDADPWFKALEARNNSSHTYNEDLAKEVYEIAKFFPPKVQELLAGLKKI